MGRFALGLGIAGLALLGASGGALSEVPAPRATVLKASVRFGRPADPAATGKLSLEGDLLAGTGFSAFDPRGGGLRVALGPAVLLEGVPPPETTRFRDRGEKGWVLTVKRPFEGRGSFSLSMSRASGLFRLKASGFPAAALRDAGPGDVAVEFLAGANGGTDVVDFTPKGSRKWAYVRRVPVKGPPSGGGGSGGGGGGSGIPPYTGGFTTIDRGWQDGIHSFRFEVVRDQAAWSALWTAHGKGGTPPAVDFSVEMVVGVFLGDRMSGGYAVTITSIAPATIIGAPDFGSGGPPGGAMVSIIEDQPGFNPVTAALTQPYHIVRTPRVDGPVLYELMTRVQ